MIANKIQNSLLDENDNSIIILIYNSEQDIISSMALACEIKEELISLEKYGVQIILEPQEIPANFSKIEIDDSILQGMQNIFSENSEGKNKENLQNYPKVWNFKVNKQVLEQEFKMMTMTFFNGNIFNVELKDKQALEEIKKPYEDLQKSKKKSNLIKKRKVTQQKEYPVLKKLNKAFEQLPVKKLFNEDNHKNSGQFYHENNKIVQE